MSRHAIPLLLLAVAIFETVTRPTYWAGFMMGVVTLHYGLRLIFFLLYGREVTVRVDNGRDDGDR